MLLDEPLAGIDPIAVSDIRDLIYQLRGRGIGVLITDHNALEVLDIVDRAYVLHEGVVMSEGAPSEIIADKDVRRVYLGERFSLLISLQTGIYRHASTRMACHFCAP